MDYTPCSPYLAERGAAPCGLGTCSQYTPLSFVSYMFHSLATACLGKALPVLCSRFDLYLLPLDDPESGSLLGLRRWPGAWDIAEVAINPEVQLTAVPIAALCV